MKKKLLLLTLCVTMALSLVACTSSSSDSKDKATSNKETAKDDDASENTYKIGICQLVQHEALDAATKGFEDALKEKLGDRVTFDEQNAQGDSATCSTIVNSFVSDGVDLILANATAPLQTAAAATSDIPILGTSITDYATALDIKDWKGVTGKNISGTSDLAPLSDQAQMLKELFPDAKNVGLLYCSAEANSEYQVEVITKELEDLGYKCQPYSFTDSNDIATVAKNAVDSSDVIYIPTDNTAASNTQVINNIAQEAKVPIIAGEEGICKGCGIATLSISYYDLGYQTGIMAYDVLENNEDVSKMEVQTASEVTKEYNPDIAKTLGIDIPDEYKALDMSE
ncbi:putative ABC transport system substrate-binding protein [Acetitomaculum ruminis DSM 5522]|uniref:Putative ABC transport system substrate-binding protein n=1 Tax=Acetitomaculum ruminis DSM 5522 TaxID=1120918 RepID=A0A1I0V3J7_9FIRM|nr:ABC transporter substrate-binding protein [Acetitomaculum ruminis]SFA70904.1 putative ABC transport system substrate-binding protein [Acetitomaculum ruminis DSM 5522]